MRLAIAGSLACVVGGFIWVYTVGTLLGPLLIIGGIGGLGGAMLPTLIEQLAGFLSTGKIGKR